MSHVKRLSYFEPCQLHMFCSPYPGLFVSPFRLVATAAGCTVVVPIINQEEGKQEGGEEEGRIDVAADKRLGFLGGRRHREGSKGR